MTRPPALAQICLSTGHRVLPWIALFFASATLAYAMNSSLGGGPSTSDQPANGQVAVSSGEPTGATALEQSPMSPSGASTDPAGSAAPVPCAAMAAGLMHAGVDWWIVAESQRIACEPGKPATTELPAACRTALAADDNVRERFLAHSCAGAFGATPKP